MREDALNRLLSFIWTKNIPGDPYEDAGGTVPALSWSEILDICIIGELAQDDSTIYRISKMIADVCSSKHGRTVFNANQKNEAYSKLKRLIDAKVPSPNFTIHEGYKIVCDAQASRVIDNRTVLDTLIERTKNIPNIADRAFIFTVLISLAKDSVRASDCGRLARAAADQIPLDLDRIEHYLTIAKEVQNAASPIGKDCISKALLDAFSSEQLGIEQMRRRVLDLLHTYEPEKRDQLTAFLDDDPARVQKKRVIEEKLKEIELRKQLADVPGFVSSGDLTHEHAEVAWQLLGGLNADRVAIISREKTRSVIAGACKLPLKDAYSILSWAIENIVRSHRGSGQRHQIVRQLFDAAIATTQIAYGAVGLTRHSAAKHNIETHSGDTSLFILDGTNTPGLAPVMAAARCHRGEAPFCDTPLLAAGSVHYGRIKR
jgi:hypothetical protein